ncbi:MAG: UDP-glucose 4-epimerase GalE [Bacteroidetes bacterium]|nr:UDP-glucose 4-epimerase GalE [Bacteroidota bacterium]
MRILVTGGAGYIGSHFVRMALKGNDEVIVADNLSRGHQESIPDGVQFEKVDIRDAEKISEVIRKHSPEAVVHFAAFAYVGESVEHPEIYYQNNVIGSYNLIRAAVESKVKYFVFSSTCSVYGSPGKVPISEEAQTNPINPYANTKLMIEMMLKDFQSAYGMKYVSLRYFNAAGADDSGEIGESHNPEPHLIPIVLEVANGKREKVSVFGNDYNTPDGTCIRDYIHVNDLSDAHIRALEFLAKGNESTIINLGTGAGNSVMEIIKTAESITGKKIEFKIAERRKGDPAILVADNTKALKILNWKPKYTIDNIIRTAWCWHQNPKY